MSRTGDEGSNIQIFEADATSQPAESASHDLSGGHTTGVETMDTDRLIILPPLDVRQNTALSTADMSRPGDEGNNIQISEADATSQPAGSASHDLSGGHTTGVETMDTDRLIILGSYTPLDVRQNTALSTADMSRPGDEENNIQISEVDATSQPAGSASHDLSGGHTTGVETMDTDTGTGTGNLRRRAHTQLVPPIRSITISNNAMVLDAWMSDNKRSVVYRGPGRTPDDSDHRQLWWCECIVDSRFTALVQQYGSSRAAKEAAAGLAIDELNNEGWALPRM